MTYILPIHHRNGGCTRNSETCLHCNILDTQKEGAPMLYEAETDTVVQLKAGIKISGFEDECMVGFALSSSLVSDINKGTVFVVTRGKDEDMGDGCLKAYAVFEPMPGLTIKKKAVTTIDRGVLEPA